MDSPKLNRRSLLGTMATLSSTLALGAVSQPNLLSLLQNPTSADKVKGILKRNFDLSFAREQSFQDFFESLLDAKAHRENRQFFLEHLENRDLEHRLELYVIEEFVVSTNYLMILSGKASELAMLPC
jgi:hypothetical protein